MAPLHQHLLILLLLLFCSIPSSTSLTKPPSPPFRPHELVLPISKDHKTSQYVITLHQRDPLVPIDLVLDLGGPFMWVDCEGGYVSNMYRPGYCKTPQCENAGSTTCGSCLAGERPGCNNNSCSIFPENTITHKTATGELAEDQIAVPSTEGHYSGRYVVVPRVLFSCAPAFLRRGLAVGASGMIGLGWSRTGLPSQLSTNVGGFPQIFAVCLASSLSSPGAVFFGAGPYVFFPGKEMSHRLLYTPLLINPVSAARSDNPGEPSWEYFIGVKSIMVAEKPVPGIDPSLLVIDRRGFGGTKVSTTTPYTVLESTIYRALAGAFERAAEAMDLAKVDPVPPFGSCYSTADMGIQRTGPQVPVVDLVLEGENSVWRMFGANSMVEVSDGVTCLAFLDGGLNPRTSIVIGGRQLEDNLVQFDTENSKFGFSNSLLFIETTCANFNFTATTV